MSSTKKPVALVTGGSAGIGRSICVDLLGKGYEVISLSKGQSDLDDQRFTQIEIDLFDRDAIATQMREIVAKFDVTTFVHNAGVIHPALLEDVDLDDVDRLTQLHLAAPIQIMKAILPAMKASSFGRVVLISSRASLGLATRTVYSATKSGMQGMARTWALELGAHGITVNVIAPGPIRTPMFFDVVPAGSEAESRIAASIPVKRLGEPEDISRVVSFLVEQSNGFLTGQVLYVCGGTSVGSLHL